MFQKNSWIRLFCRKKRNIEVNDSFEESNNPYIKRFIQGEYQFFVVNAVFKTEVYHHNGGGMREHLKAHTYYYFKKDSEIFFITKSGFNKNMANFFKECNEVSKKIKRGIYAYDEFPLIVNEIEEHCAGLNLNYEALNYIKIELPELRY